MTGPTNDDAGNHGDDNDGSSSSRGDNEERDRLLLRSRSVDRPAARRVHTAYAEARCGSASSSTSSSSRWVAIVLLCVLGLILRNALVTVRAKHQQALEPHERNCDVSN